MDRTKMFPKSDRSLNVIGAYLCSVMGATVTWSVITGWHSWTNGFASLVPMPERLFQFLAVTAVAAVLVGVYMLLIAAIPFLVVYRIAKRWRIGNIAYYLICGAFAGLVLTPIFVWLLPRPYFVVEEPPFLEMCATIAPVLATSGAVGALVFWWMEGRNLHKTDHSEIQKGPAV